MKFLKLFQEITKVDMSTGGEPRAMESQKATGSNYYNNPSRHGPTVLKALELVSKQ